MKRIKPLKRRVDGALRNLCNEEFRIVSGSDTGWFGDGMYVLTNDHESLRVTRSHGEEFLDIAFKPDPNDKDWIGVAELMVAIADISLEDALEGRAVPHDLDFKLSAYLRIKPTLFVKLGPDPASSETLTEIRRQARVYALQRYGIPNKKME
jgi:hypothetical protein